MLSCSLPCYCTTRPVHLNNNVQKPDVADSSYFSPEQVLKQMYGNSYYRQEGLAKGLEDSVDGAGETGDETSQEGGVERESGLPQDFQFSMSGMPCWVKKNVSEQL